MAALKAQQAADLARKAFPPAAIVAGAAVATLLLHAIGVVPRFEQWLYDVRARGTPTTEVADAIVPIAVDDDSTDHLGRWPWPRPRTAHLVRDLDEAGAGAILVDLTFNDATDPAQDADFVSVIAGAKSAVAAVSVMPAIPTAQMLARLSDDRKRALAAFEARVPVEIPGAEAAFPKVPVAATITPPLADFMERGTVGFSSIEDDSDGVLRRAPLLRADRSPGAPGGRVRYIPSLPLATLCRWYSVAPGSLRARRGALILPGARAPGEKAPHDVVIPVDSGARMWVGHARPGVIASRFLSARDVIAAFASEDPRGRPKVKDRLPLVYLSFTGAGDMHATPLSTSYPGGLWNAEVLNTVLTRQFVRDAPAGTGWLLGLVEAVLLVLFASRWTSYRLGAALLGVFFVLLVAGFGAFRLARVVVPLAAPATFVALGGIAVVFWKTFLEDRERIDLMFALRALQNQALKDRRVVEERPTTIQGSTGAATSDAESALKRNVEYGRFIESLRDIESLQNTYIGKHYRLLNLIDEGGMGLVFRAYDEALDRTVAIKVLTRYSAKLLKRFQTEARAVGQLQHPNVVQVFAVASEGDIPYIVMEYVHGTSLSQRIRDDGPLPVIQGL
ncbi:MAG TPA: CHASE2 domain-containing protein, partial [bacterium]|nr:CHASE2 domain-containing protein [bacterium]